MSRQQDANGLKRLVAKLTRQDSAELIEVQTGSYLGEGDIIRIEDDYQRS